MSIARHAALPPFGILSAVKEIQMNEYNLLILSERLLSLYAEGKIVADGVQYTDEFKSLIGDLKDAVSNIE